MSDQETKPAFARELTVVYHTLGEMVLKSDYDQALARNAELVEMIFKHDKRASENLQDANDSREKLRDTEKEFKEQLAAVTRERDALRRLLEQK